MCRAAVEADGKQQLIVSAFTGWQVLSAAHGSEAVGTFPAYLGRLGLIEAPPKPARVPHPKGRRQPA